MNKISLLFHLKEAAEQLNSTIKDLENDPEYEIGAFTVDMSHLYHHLNFAWNGRNCMDEDLAASNFHKWRKFPTDSELLLG